MYEGIESKTIDNNRRINLGGESALVREMRVKDPPRDKIRVVGHGSRILMMDDHAWFDFYNSAEFRNYVPERFFEE